MKRIKSGRAVGLDDILVEIWRCVEVRAVDFF